MSYPTRKSKNHYEGTSNTNRKKNTEQRGNGKGSHIVWFWWPFWFKRDTSSMKTKPNTHLLSEMLFLRKQYTGICPRALEASSIVENVSAIIVHIHYYIHYDSKSPAKKAKFSFKLNSQWVGDFFFSICEQGS